VATEPITRQSSISAQSASHSLTHRYAPRFPVTGIRPVKVDLGPAGAGQIVDISTGGMRVKSVAPLRRQAEVPIRIDSLSSPLQCSGVVVWSKATGTAGIRFTNLTDTQQKILSGWLSDLEQASTGGTIMSEQADEYTRTINQIRNAKLNNADALSVIAQRALEVTSASGSAIALGKPENMVCLGSAGDAPEIGTVIPPSAGLTGECLRNKKLVLCHNAQTDPRVGKGSTLGSAVIVPLLVNGDVRGVLEAFAEQPHAFDAKAIDMLEHLADAATYVTYGNTPTRRLATVMPISTPPVMPAGIHTAAYAAPVITPVVKSPAMQPASEPIPKPMARPAASISAPPLEPLPLAEILSTPATPRTRVTTPVVQAAAKEALLPLLPPSPTVVVRPKPATSGEIDLRQLLEVEEPAEQLRVSAPEVAFPDQYEFEKPATARWTMRAIAAGVILVAPLWFFVLRSKPVDTANATAAQDPAVAAQSPSPANFTVTPATAAPISTPAPTASASTKPASTPAVSKVRSTEPMDVVADVVKKPEPAPIVLAASRSLTHSKLDDAESPAVPVAMPAGMVSVPAVPGPSTVATPSLAPRVTKTWTGGTLIKRLPPMYPSTAKARGIHGEVEVLFTVRKDGSVGSVRAMSGNPILANAAVEAVKTWRYEPYKADGEPMEVQNTVKLNFVLPR
jgi:TonB family protein